MNGEGISSGAVIAVKTHDFDHKGWSKKELVCILKKISSIYIINFVRTMIKDFSCSLYN